MRMHFQKIMSGSMLSKGANKYHFDIKMYTLGTNMYV